MSSTATTGSGSSVAGTPSSSPHASWWSKAAGVFVKIGRAIKTGLSDILNEQPKIAAAIQEVAPNIEAASNLIFPGAGTFEQHILDAYGVLSKAVSDAGAAVGSVSITTPAGSTELDAQLVQDIKTFAPQIAALFDSAASSTPAPAAAVKLAAQAPAKG